MKIEQWDGGRFGGAKAAFIHEDRLVVLRRDNLEGLMWSGMIDLPGGGREAEEGPIETLLRETREEVGLILSPDCLVYGRARQNKWGKTVWFYIGHITKAESQSLQLGDEGQACWMMPIADFISAKDAIPPLQESLREAGY